MFNKIRRLWNTPYTWNITRQISTFTQPLYFQISPMLCAQPMRKKRKLDPAILRVREDRRRRKLWKAIKRILKLDKQLKPLDEIEIPENIEDEKEKRLRPRTAQSPEVLEDRYIILKRWKQYKCRQYMADIRTLDSLVFSQQRALDELKNISEELYNKAVEIDETLIPFESSGTVWTPPIKNYESPDGEYFDITKKW